MVDNVIYWLMGSNLSQLASHSFTPNVRSSSNVYYYQLVVVTNFTLSQSKSHYAALNMEHYFLLTSQFGRIQSLQKCTFSLWYLRLRPSTNDLKQILQRKGLSFSWTDLRCRLRLLDDGKEALQAWHLKAVTFSWWTVSPWRLRQSVDPKEAGQAWHLKSFTFWWTAWTWRSTFLDDPK
jgi:hypothetical protein